MSHVDPLPDELSQLRQAAHAAHSVNLSHVDSVISRLERARNQLAQQSNANDELLSLSSYFKTSGAGSAKAHKEWGNAVNRLAKSVEKKYGAPPAPLFPPPPPPPAPTQAAKPPTLGALRRTNEETEMSQPQQDRLPFSNPEALAALNETIAVHLARIGAFTSLSTFLSESGTPSPPSLTPELLDGLKGLHAILEELRSGECKRAIEWVEARRRALSEEAGPENDDEDEEELLFQLRKEEYIRLVLKAAMSSRSAPQEDDAMAIDPTSTATDAKLATRRKSSLASTSSSILHTSSTTASAPVNPHLQEALTYGGQHFRPLLLASSSSPNKTASNPKAGRTALVCSLLTSPLYLPLERLLSSPYGSLYAPYVSSPPDSATTQKTAASTNEPLLLSFTNSYLRSLSLPKNSPLSVVTDVGGSGALAKIRKVRAVMKEKKTEWSAVGELPVEIPLPLPYRYHSIFACPVSKEQSTAQNPPMLLPCGHVIARESLMRLARGTPTLKCPYCPVVSHFNACVRVHF
ncbi:hypothetical protein JCM10908_000394 [Rhodotorula pacifica]|uniref:ubiquitin-protein ligase RMD5 n=1 Tax=Rhodotorula pacifica TaxID=1495444 RepID=UPI003172C29B